jgi:hypothetical protein
MDGVAPERLAGVLHSLLQRTLQQVISLDHTEQGSVRGVQGVSLVSGTRHLFRRSTSQKDACFTLVTVIGFVGT